MNILIFGVEGQVAKALRFQLPQAICVSRPEADLCDPETLKTVLDRHRPDVVINAAAYTQVDKAETERELAWRINARAPGVIATWCAGASASFIHYSTDYVYGANGNDFLFETDSVDPQNEYGRTKLEGERAVHASGCHHLILRTSWVYSEHGKNFVKLMLLLGKEREHLSVVYDQVGSPTYAADIAQGTAHLLQHPAFRSRSGVYNLANSGVTSWLGFANAIFDIWAALGGVIRVRAISPISTAAYPAQARRPLNSRLNSARLRSDFGIHLRPWPQALCDCLRLLKRSELNA